jgi:hypothetical protein
MIKKWFVLKKRTLNIKKLVFSYIFCHSCYQIDEYNETIADVDDGTMSEASDLERCEGVAVEEGVVGEAMRHVDKGTGDTGGTPEDDLHVVGGSERQVDRDSGG